ncbi:dihydrolipoamide acetyltransferase [Rhodopirellula bahusiensis]|uniref:Dihydrolipoamide acetyltransferase n=1 Tax=Rhodopirellula bahusiensis TaxID=2014065 RepID=A0A2G1VXM5_9BACT|nr:dihydrolipoamide acetyltransferase [Rhodopirellula bahusiensis]PHQ31522.1 dihydrolipoamide acetyltransferase [Rhodopirellula bahusiensis]
MADENKTDDKPELEDAPAKPRSNTSLIVLFVGMVVVLETGMFFFLVPSAEQVSALAEAELIQSVQEGAEKAEQEQSDENQEIEFDLGAFGETFSPIETERSFRVELRLYGLIRKKNRDKMTKEFDSKKGRLRHAIRMKIRNSELNELTENQLGLLQRRILTTCNHLLDEDLLLGVGFHEFQLIEE